MKASWIPMLITAVAITACGDDGGGTSKPDTSPDVVFPDGTDTSPDTPNPNIVRVLEFEQAFGDDQKPCRQQPRCFVSISFTEQRPLKMVYTEDGVVVAGQTVKFAIENDAAGLGFLNTLSAVSDAAGIAQVVTKAKTANVGQFAVKAYIDGVANPPPAKYFDVVVSPKGQVPLTVVATYGGQRAVSNFNVRLYKQNAQGAPGCTNLQSLLDDATAAVTRDNTPLNQSARFPDFDNLENDKTQKYTILTFSQQQAAGSAPGAILAWGCNATEGIVEWGKAKTVTVPMTDRPPTYAGAYDVISKFDFISAIPLPYRTYVDYVVSFFRDPTGTILTLACDLLTGEGETLNSFCDLVFDEVGGDLQLTALGGFVSDLLNAVIDGLAGDSIFGTIFTVGGDVADILKQFELRSTFTFKKEPDASGNFAAGDVTENWHTVRVKWTLGANCDPDTESGCGTIQQNLQQFGYAGGAINGEPSVSVAAFYNMTIAQHPLNLRYGALLSFFAEKLLIPLIIHGTDTSTWSVDSYNDLLGYLVGSGSACLTAGINDTVNCPESSGDQDCCCRKFADGVNNENHKIDGGTETAVAAACDVIIETAPTFLRTKLEELDIGGEGFTLGTLEPCKMNDSDNDLKIDGFGTQSNPCKWNVVIKAGATTVTIDSKFYGQRSE